MKMPRLTPDGAGRGCFMTCWAVCGPLLAVLGHGNIGIAIRAKSGVTGLQMAFTAVLLFGHVPPCWTRAQNSRLEAIGDHTSGGKLLMDIGT